MEAVITVWLLSLGVSQTSGLALSPYVHMCTDTCVRTGMCRGSTLQNIIACYINTGRKKDKGFEKQKAQEHSGSAEVTEFVCVTGGSTRGSTSCLFDRCTVFVEPKQASECRPPPWELRDVADKVYNCTKGDRHGKCTRIRVPDGYEEYKAGNETIFVKEYPRKMTWDRATKQCRSDGARLIKLDKREKNEAMTTFKAVHWIGLQDIYENNTFFWTDGSPLQYSAWSRGQPSHQTGPVFPENCVSMSLNKKKMKIEWNDRFCYQSKPFLCEKLL